MSEIQIFKSDKELGKAAAKLFLAQANEALDRKGFFTAVLSGGSGPRELYHNLAQCRAGLEWKKVHFFWGDERLVPPESAESNFGFARRAFLEKLGLPESNLHRVRGEEPNPEKAAQDYAREIRAYFKAPEGGFPSFDLVLLGLGPDGHTASLLPGSAALQELEQLAVPVFHARRKEWRVTLTPPVFNHAARVVFLVHGQEKASALLETLRGQPRPELYPAQIIHPKSKDLMWMVDEAAASAL